jgi:hypothetical protein
MPSPPDQPQPLPTAAGDTPNEKADLARRRKQRLRTGLAFGIGSAAIAGALLYANRPARRPK